MYFTNKSKNTNNKLILIMNKKAISPLIATVLLVGFSIVLAGIVTTFVIDKTKEFNPEKIVEDDLLCDNIAIDITVPDQNALIYETASNVKILKGLNLTNKGSFTIHKVTINSPGFPSKESPLNPIIKPGEGYDQLSLGVRDPTIEEVITIIPWIKHPEEENTYIKCQRSEIKIIPKKICEEILGTGTNCPGAT